MQSATPFELAKSYSPSDSEAAIRAAWKSAGCFHADPDPDAGGEPFAIVIPPPNVTAALHLGHALNNTIQDVLTRVHRMRGFRTLWMPGTDHAGIATQTVVEKRLLLEGKRRTDFTREAFIAKVQEWKDEYEATILAQLDEMGCSCDEARTRFTMDPVCAAAVREAFFLLFRDGLIYRGKRLVNWDPVSQTALADDEVEMEEIDGGMHELRYPIVDDAGRETGEFVTVATTRPETMLGDTAVAINPRDPRAAALRGTRIRLPIVGRIIPIVEDDYVVMPVSLGGDPKDPKAAIATGFLKVTPAHDPNDYEIGRRHSLAVINVMAPDASISDGHGWSAIEEVSDEARAFLGLSREAARAKVLEWFKAKGLLASIKPYRHSVGHSYRSHVPIEPYLSDQWYVKVTDDRLRGAALRSMDGEQFDAGLAAQSVTGADAAAELTHRGTAPGDGGLRFWPERYAKTFQQWHENLRDWCISRQLWWGHRIPVWSGNAALPATLSTALDGERAASRTTPEATFVAVRDPEGEDRDLVGALEAAGFTRDPDVLDTWFSSALWPLSTMGWPNPEAFPKDIPEGSALLEAFNPTSVLCTAREIITLWVSRMVMFNRYFRGGTLPFRHVFIHAMIQDGFGQKMSKSLGNGVDPRDIIHSHGADAMRFVLVQMTTNTQDVRLPVDMIDPATGEVFTPKTFVDPAGYTVAEPYQIPPAVGGGGAPGRKLASGYGVSSGKVKPTAEVPLARNTSSRFDLGRNFCNKLWNATRFALGNLDASGANGPAYGADPIAPPRLVDRWILAQLAATVRRVDTALADYQFNVYAEAMYDFVWRDFCDWYLESIKPTVRGDAIQQQVLRTVLNAILRLLHPITPFVTEALWPAVRGSGPAGVSGLSLPDSELLAVAGWPRPTAALDQNAACVLFGRAQELVSAIRNLRGERRVQPKKKIVLHAPDSIRALVASAEGMVETLAGLERVEAMPTSSSTPPIGAILFTAEGAECMLGGLVDAVDNGAEAARLDKVIAELSRQVSGFKSKLDNAGYVAKAPPAVVEETKGKLSAAEAELAAAQSARARIA